LEFPLLYDHEQTNNVAELRAATEAVRIAILRNRDLVLHTDSHLVWHFFHNMRARYRLVNWRGFDSCEEMAALDSEIRHLVHRMSRRVFVVKVRAHNGNEGNFAADRAAQRARNLSGRSRYGSAFTDSRYIRTDPEPAGRALRASLPHPCALCGKRYKTTAALKTHRTKAHRQSLDSSMSPGHDKGRPVPAEGERDPEWDALQRAVACVLAGTSTRRRLVDRPSSSGSNASK